MGYVAPRWLPGPHVQTIWPAVIAPRLRRMQTVAYRRERWTTPDNDFIDLDFACTARPSETATATSPSSAPRLQDPDPRPLVVLFHGLEGSSTSHYATAICAQALQQGWRAVVPMFRGCSGEPNIAPRAYHSGDSNEIDWILRRLHREHASHAPLFAMGISLGGNALAKWLGERAEQAAFITAAATVCAPHDLQAGAKALATGFNRVYTASFMRTLKHKSLLKLQRYPGLFDRERMLAARDFFDFDDAVTAPMHGFSSCYDYWTRSSCRQFLGGIRVPTLILNTLNDPFVPASVLAGPEQVSRQVELDYPTQGGHVGFASSGFPGRFDFVPQRVLDFFGKQLSMPAAKEETLDG
jgi:predicted alpha/beta-fold hydrolase